MKTSDRILETSTTALDPLVSGSVRSFTPATAGPREARGVITEIDFNQQRFGICDGNDSSIHRYQWNERTRFMQHGKAVTAAALKVGEAARLICMPGGGIPIAYQVRLAPANTERHTSAHREAPHQS